MGGVQPENKKLITQESLQPQKIKKGEKAYQSVLDIEERLQKGDATNIALTGPYGSGKSSILITLKEDFPKHHYLNISLATLKPSDAITKEKRFEENNDAELSKLNLDRLIEYSILQQLIYKEKQNVLPNSRFKRIFHLTNKRVCEITIAILLAVLAIIIVFEPSFLKVEWLCKLFGKEWMNVVGDSISIIYLLWFAYKAISMIVPAVSNSRLNKLNLKDGEIEVVENTSIFNKHLDEILYFFEKTDYDVVMLEDLDRFESIDIFLKLRELNLLLNESKVIERKIFFVYAVRDDMFQDAERVKCFDYITTVIPVINRSNAKNQLKEELQKRGVTEISDHHLQELGFFLYDMRLLKNIANEYVQYRGKLSEGISSEKLLGMIVYKNFYPQDFADLHDCKGIVYQLFNLKEEFVAARIEGIEELNVKKQEQQEANKKECHLKESELRRIYLEEYRDRMIATMQHIKLDDNNYSIKDVAANEKLFEKLIGASSVKYTYIDANYYNNQTRQTSLEVDFSQIEKSVDPTRSYKERLEALRYAYEELENADKVEIRKDDIRSLPLSQLMSEIDYAANPSYNSLKVPRLIEFLVVKGYIDENYYDYISYFYANFIDAHDWDYVLDLKLNKAHSYDYHINNVEACLYEIPKPIYRKNAILNIDLVDYLAGYQVDRMNKMRLLAILRTAVEGKKYDFLAAYYQKGRQQDVVFPLLYNQYKGQWNVSENKDDDKQSLKLSWFKYAEKDQSCEGSRKWLNEHFAFMTDNFLDIDAKHWCTLIGDGKYQFDELNAVSRDILNAVVGANAYKLTRHNVEVIVSYLLEMNLDSVSYTLVNQTEHEPLIELVEDNLGLCMRSVFAAPESKKENVDAILGIMLDAQVTESDKMAYLKDQQNKIDLEQVEQKDVKTLALKCDVVNVSWDNVIHYMNSVCEKKADDVLTAFVERHADELAEIAVPQNPEDDERMLLRQFIKSDVLSIETYRKIINQFTRWRFTGVPSIEERRVLLLIAKNTIHFKKENTADMLSKYSPSAVVTYLLKNKRDFLREPESVAYTTEVAVGLMKSSLSIREKAMLIPCFGESILNKELANEVISVMKLQEIDLVDSFFVNVMMLSDRIDEKIIVLGNVLEKRDLDEPTITTVISTLPGKYKEIAEKGKKPEIPNNVWTIKLVKILVEKEYISSYSETKSGIRINTKLK